MPTRAAVGKAADAIEAELRRIGLWQDEPPAPEAFEFQQAFAMDTMAFTQWLQWVFLPQVRSIVAGQGDFPSSSMVGTQALRELDGHPDTDRLLTLLADFDGMFTS